MKLNYKLNVLVSLLMYRWIIPTIFLRLLIGSIEEVRLHVLVRLRLVPVTGVPLWAIVSVTHSDVGHKIILKNISSVWKSLPSHQEVGSTCEFPQESLHPWLSQSTEQGVGFFLPFTCHTSCLWLVSVDIAHPHRTYYNVDIARVHCFPSTVWRDACERGSVSIDDSLAKLRCR